MAPVAKGRRTALVTGAGGFLGRHVLLALRAAGWQTLGLHRPSEHGGSAISVADQQVEGDVLDMDRVAASVPPELHAVVHCAGNTSLWRRNGPELLRVNVKGTRNVMRFARDRGARLVHMSCALAFGQHAGVIHDDTPRIGRNSPITLVRSKAMAELEIERGLGHGLDAVVLNPAFLLGGGDRNNWSRLVRLIQARRLPGVPAGGGTFCAVETAAAAAVQSIDELRSGERLLIGGVSVSFAGLAREIGTQLGHRRFLRPVHPSLLNGYARLEETVAPLFGREPDVTTEAVRLLSGNVYCEGRIASQRLQLPETTLETMVARCIDGL